MGFFRKYLIFFSVSEKSGPIIPNPKIIPFRLPLPEGFEWGIIDLQDEAQVGNTFIYSIKLFFI